MFFGHKVVQVLQHLSQLVKLRVTGLLCKAELTSVSVTGSIVKNDFLTHIAHNYYSTYSLLCGVTGGRGSWFGVNVWLSFLCIDKVLTVLFHNFY